MIENYIGWPVGVSKVILSESSITMGDGATNTDNLESGGKRTELKGGYISDKYSVVMEYEWEAPMSQSGKTEYQAFCEWYKYKHKFGSVPFVFPKIVYSPQTGIEILDNPQNEPEYFEYYKITSGISNAQRSGSKMKISMTWETVYGGIVQYTDPALNENNVSVSAKAKYVDVSISNIPYGTPAPTAGNFTIKIDNQSTAITASYFDDDTGNMRLWYDEVTTEGTHIVDVTVNYQTIVNKTKSATFEV